MLKCQYCGKECKKLNRLRNHERLCKNNPNRQLTTYERGIDPFAMSRRFGAISDKEGSSTYSDEFNRKCPHCNKWFKPSQIGGHIARCSKVHNEDRKVILAGGIILDITVPQLEHYKLTHNKCEICGKTVEESVKYKGKYASKQLCVDHNHQTNEFRGMLCQMCNRQLGWYEKHRESVDKYLSKK